MDRRIRRSSYGLSLIFPVTLLGLLVGAFFLGVWYGSRTSVVAPSPICETGELQAALQRMQENVLEAQQEYRRCILSHPISKQASVRSGLTPIAEGDDGEVGSRRASFLRQLEPAKLVPSSSSPIDIVFVWINGTDPSWQYARHASEFGDLLPQYHDNGGLLVALRSICKYGSGLGIGTIHIVTVFGQRPMFLKSLPGVPEVRLVELSEAAVDSVPKLLHRVHEIPGLREDFLLWNERGMLGKTAQRSDFWVSFGGWGPRFHLDPRGRRHPETDCLLDRVLGLENRGNCKSRDAPSMCRPIPMSVSGIRQMLQHRTVLAQSSGFDFAHLYVHWMIEHGLAGSIDGTDDDAFVVRLGNQIDVQDVMRKSHLHLFTCFDDDHGYRIPVLEDLLKQRWSFKAMHEE